MLKSWGSVVKNSFVTALDNFTSSQIGENGTCEFSWSNSFKERIVQLSFQLTRTRDEAQLYELANIYKQLLLETQTNNLSKDEYIYYMSIFYRMIAHTRDIIDGKGEYSLSYMLLNTWAEYANQEELAKFMFKQFVVNDDQNIHPFGSWKDVKKFYKFNPSSPLISYAVNLINDQLRIDITSDTPSLAAKWVPREKSSQGALFTILATDYFKNYIITAQTEDARKRATLKAKTDYRKLISSLNKKLDTVQIKQCANTWAEIKPEVQTSITMHKQKKAFLNLKANGDERYNNDDRRLCAEHFTKFAEKASNGEVDIKGKRVGLEAMVKNALDVYNLSSAEKDILNAQWINNSKTTGALGKMIAMVDVSGSMYGDPMNAAIGLGLRIAEKSMLGKRVLTFSASPSWVNLDGVNKFTDMVDMVRRADWGMNTNFTAALNMILEAIIQSNLDASDVEDMVLVILSDMQMDQADKKSTSLMASIEASYADAGLRVCGKPYKPPHILFWNLRSTSGFPTLSSQKNASMMSGFSPALLNLFCEEGINSLESCTPWSIFITALENNRYKILDDKLKMVIG